MIAADTNVVIRLIMADDKAQYEAVKKRLPEGLFISHGVLMEVEWVLRSSYRLGREQVNHALGLLLSLDEIRIPKLSSVLWALDQHGEGADLADMLHLIAAVGCSSFLTFDKGILEATKTDKPIEVELLT
jgi:predicted nucleic-acid-binding protein